MPGTLGHTTKYYYDGVLDLVKVVHPNAEGWPGGQEPAETYTYDAFHHLLRRTDETGAVFATLRDGEGNLLRIMNNLNNGKAKKSECNQLTAYLRDKARHGENLNAQERNTAQKLRVDVQSGNFSLSGPVEFKASPNITQNQTQLLSLF